MRLIDGNKLILWLNDSWYGSFKYEESPTSIAIKEVMKAIEEYVVDAPTIEPSEQVTGKLKNPCDSLLTEDSEDSKEHKSKLEPSAVTEVTEVTDTDLIRRSDAVEVADRECFQFRGTFSRIEEGINALPTADTVSRKAYEELYNKWIEAEQRADYYDVDGEDEASGADRPHGKWLPQEQMCEYRCDQCGKIVFADDENELNFCPNCGSDTDRR